MTRIYADFHGLRGLARGKIRIIRENPLNPCSINNNRWRLIVVTVICRGRIYPSRGYARTKLTGRYPSLINERGNLGTDKSVPYKFMRGSYDVGFIWTAFLGTYLI
ncbi:MAG: hypothetical protein FWG87_13135 [Defluviitaleaceae bacterium]|nr:hypothetical protein [Defluviitaleaceae bacterium]